MDVYTAFKPPVAELICDLHGAVVFLKFTLEIARLVSKGIPKRSM
jgi:hypothetical protein